VPGHTFRPCLLTRAYQRPGVGVALTLFSSGSLGGFGHATICAAQPNVGYSSSNWTSNLGVAHRPGTWIIVNGTLSACATTPASGSGFPAR
jgi:hypothetical protein